MEMSFKNFGFITIGKSKCEKYSSESGFFRRVEGTLNRRKFLVSFSKLKMKLFLFEYVSFVFAGFFLENWIIYFA